MGKRIEGNRIQRHRTRHRSQIKLMEETGTKIREQKKKTENPQAKKRMEGTEKRNSKRNERRMGRGREGQRTETETRRARGTRPDGAALWEKGE